MTCARISGISYFNTRLLRRDCPARYVGVTHEYLEVPTRPERLESAWFVDHACGSNRASKSQRDIQLLLGGLEAEPANARYMFYLAQSCKDAGQLREAIAWYQRRVAAGGWAEEVWYSLYMIALCHAGLGDGEKLLEYALRAFDFRPGRAEPLWSLASHYRAEGDYQACLMFAEMAQRIPYPTGDSLFVNDWVYRAGVSEEISIAAYYCDETHHEKGRAASTLLSTQRGVDDATRSLALRNLYYYLKGCQQLFVGTEVKEISIDPPPSYRAMNPSIWSDAAGVRCVVRTVNYQLVDGQYRIFDPANTIRTRNFAVDLNEEFDVRAYHPIDDRSGEAPLLPNFIEGCEDCRLFRCRGRWWSVATVRNRCRTGRCEIALLTLDDALHIERIDVIRSINPDCHQKNWAPLVRDDELFLVYSNDPTVVLHYDFNQRDASVAYYGHPGPCLENFRGSSQIIRGREGWIYLTHESVPLADGERFYCHRFVTMNDDFRVAGFTEPFYFIHKGIEFCAGLARDPRRGRLVASFGVNDERAHLAFFDEDTVYARIVAA